jgi:hypothetical protein
MNKKGLTSLEKKTLYTWCTGLIGHALLTLSTLVGTVATLLAVITPSEVAEAGGDASWYPKWSKEPGMDRLMNLDYWTVLLIIIMIVTGLIMRVLRHLSEVWKPGDEGPILARVGGANLPADGGGTASVN